MNTREIIGSNFEIDHKTGFLFIGDVKCERIVALTKDLLQKAISIMASRNLFKLNFGSPFEKEREISFLENFKFLKGLGIGYNNFDITPVLSLNDLEELSISFHFIGIINFSNFPKLKEVHINWNNEGVDSLLKCDQLSAVSIINYTRLTLSDFQNWKMLNNLFLYDPKSISLEGIGQLQNLKILKISGAKKLNDLGDIEELQNLEHFTLHGAKNLKDLTPIAYLRNLKVLNLDTLGSILSIKFVEALHNLEEFYMTESTNVLDGDLSVLVYLRKNHKLKKVGFANRKHYSHTREDLGYQMPPEVAAIFAKKRK